jgi:acetyl esterase/lipase
LIELHEGGSVRSRIVGLGSAVVVRPVLGVFPVRGPLAPAMKLLDVAARAIPGHCGVARERVLADGWYADLFRPQGVDRADAAIVYFHGGAFLFAGTSTHRRLAERLALETGRPVLSVAYRQWPHADVTGSVSDAVAAVNWLLDRGYDPSRIIVAGDSAGGHLAFTVARIAAEHGVRLGGLLAISPWLDLDNTEREAHPNATRELMLPAYRIGRVAELVTGSRDVDPALSPINQRVDDLPPTILIASEREVLLHDSERMERRLDEAGVPVELHVWSGQVHCFPVLGHLIPESREAIALMADFVVAVFGEIGEADSEIIVA